MIGVKLAKYKNTKEAKHWMCKQSLKSDRYQGIFLLTSSNNPPQILQTEPSTHYTLPMYTIYTGKYWYTNKQYKLEANFFLIPINLANYYKIDFLRYEVLTAC